MGRLDPITFGRQLVLTEDLDPTYCLLARAGLERDRLSALLLAYWCFYDLGTSCDIASTEHYWAAMTQAASGRARRGSERRHFRGKTSTRSVAYLMERYATPVQAIEDLIAVGEPRTFAAVASKAREWPGFGPWIAFKIADMIERVVRLPVDFTADDLAIYSEPLAGAKLIASDLPSAVYLLERSLGELTSPPSHDRRLNIQEYETILCKFKSHVNGHYEIGHDTIEVRRSLSRSDSSLARHLMRSPIGSR